MDTQITITREIAQKVRDTVDAGLVSGLGAPTPGQMCVEAAVCYALGLPHKDDPGCVAQSLRRLKIRLNDEGWSSIQARARGLRRLAVAQLGSAGVLNEKEFARRVTDVTIRRMVPQGLRAVASKLQKAQTVASKLQKAQTNAAKLEAAAMRCEKEGTREACQEAHDAASAAAYAADAAAYAANAAASAAYAASAAALRRRLRSRA